LGWAVFQRRSLCCAENGRRKCPARISRRAQSDVGLAEHSPRRKEIGMLWTVFVVLLVLWLLGLVSSYTLGGFIHILLLLALITLVFNLVTGRRSAV